jgi:predicted hydrocarbon binding protein
LKNELGVLANVLSSLAEAGVDILHIDSSVQEDGKCKVASLFVEPVRAKIGAQRLRSLVNSSSYILSSVINESKEGLLVDSITFPLCWNADAKAILLSWDFLSAMFRKLRDTYGSGVDSLLYELGLAFGVSGAQGLISNYGREFYEKNFKEILMTYSGSGWGRPELVDLDLKNLRATLRMRDSFECASQKTEKPNSQFLRGDISSLFSVAFKVPVRCEEAKCIAKGDEFCEFVISRA